MAKPSETQNPPIILPRHQECPGGNGRFDTFPATLQLRSHRTEERLLFEITFRKTGPGAFDAHYRIVHLGSKEELAKYPIANDAEARVLYNRFRTLNPEFRPN